MFVLYTDVITSVRGQAMQVNAIDNQNFKGATIVVKKRMAKPAQENIADTESRQETKTSKANTEKQETKFNDNFLIDPEFNKQIKVLDKIVEKVNSDVHPSTIIATIIAVLTAAYSVRKLTPIARRFFVKSGEVIASASTKAFGAIVNKFKKKPINVDGALEKIATQSSKLINENKNSKLPQQIGEFVDTVIGRENGKTEALLRKVGIKDGASLFDAGVAIAAGAITLDPVSDKVEEHNDRKEIINAVSEIITK